MVKKKKKNFTLIEILIVVIIAGILVTLGIPVYNNMIENANAKVCKTNLGVLLGALDAYGLENDQLPGSLGQLKNEHLQKGWAKVFEKENIWSLKLAYAIVDFNKRGLAYAQGAWVDRYLGDLKYFRCPSDNTPPPDGYSYGLEQSLAAMPYADYKALPEDTLVVADSDTSTFVGATERHRKYSVAGVSFYGLGVTKGKDKSCHGAGCLGMQSSPLGKAKGEHERHDKKK